MVLNKKKYLEDQNWNSFLSETYPKLPNNKTKLFKPKIT